MASNDVVYRVLLQDALVVATNVGVWVFHEAKNANNIEHMVGYMLGRIEDFERRRAWARKEARRRFLSERIASWSRALRLIQRVKGGPYRELCGRLIEDFERDPAFDVAYVSPHEVESRPESRTGKLKAGPPRKNGRPRKFTPKPVDYKPCGECDGAGFFRLR